MASGGIPARTVLLVAYPSANVLGADSAKSRVRGNVHVVAEADLSGANLAGAVLTGANLAGANLTGADLTGVQK
jgi:uncharacterized protein YjbI with pentapeptide repeats